jgi:hypothetical protein
MAEYTVTEALVKLKLATKKIADATQYVLTGFVTSKTANVPPAGFATVDVFVNTVKQRLDSVKGLISFRDRLKKAIVESNARTNVVVGSKNMTVAEAIETKHSIDAKKALFNKVVSEWRSLETLANQKNSTLEQRADQFVTQLFSQNAGATETDKAQARKNFMDNNTSIILTHNSVKDYIERLKEEIDEFETNVDVALSVVNATTKVNVED